MDKLFLALIPTFGIIGTFLIMYSDNHKVKIDPMYGIDKIASQLIPNISPDKIKRHEKLYFSQNRKMKLLKIIGIILIISSVILTIP